MELNGKNIKNYHNELLTDIQLSADEQGMHFNLNDGNNMCGEVLLHIDDINGEYLYLFNDAKEKYELIQKDDLDELRLTSPGKYLVTESKMKTTGVKMKWILLSGGILILTGIGIYIISRRKYWFW